MSENWQDIELQHWSQWRIRWLPRIALVAAIWAVFQVVDLSWGYMWRWERDYAWQHRHPEYWTKCDKFENP